MVGFKLKKDPRRAREAPERDQVNDRWREKNAQLLKPLSDFSFQRRFHTLRKGHVGGCWDASAGDP